MATMQVWTFARDVRMGSDLSGYDVDARDGEIGSVDEATNDVGASYLIVDTGPWIFGKRVLLPAGVIERVDHGARRIQVGLTRDQIKNAPEYDVEAPVSPAYRQELGSYYAGLRAIGEDPTRTSLEPQRRAQRSRSSSSRSTSSSRRSRSTTSSRSRSRATRSRTRRQSDEPTKEELYAQAKRLGIEGRSKMNKTQLKRAITRARGRSTGRQTSRRSQSRSTRSRGTGRGRANPVEVQAFLDGVSYPTRKGDLVREAERSGARREVRSTLQRLPEERFESPTEVSEAIGKLR
jgi:Protein of unknown function (DUF2795)